MVTDKLDLIIIGAGPAGLTAGIYSGRSGLETLIIDGGTAGGNAADAPTVDNYPGLEEISGRDLAEKMKKHASKYVNINEAQPVKSLEIGETKKIETREEEYEAEGVIIATGTEYRKLGVTGEEKFDGKGVSYCATCDGFFFKDKPVLVVGGGNSAVADATHLLDLGCEVTLIHRRKELRAEKAMQNSFFDKGGEVIWNSVLEEIKGNEKVESVKIKNVEDDEESEIEVEGVFISIGEKPKSELAREIGIELDDGDHIKTGRDQRTNLSKIYAAGDVTGDPKQIVVACAEGAKAAISAHEDIKNPYWAD